MHIEIYLKRTCQVDQGITDDITLDRRVTDKCTPDLARGVHQALYHLGGSTYMSRDYSLTAHASDPYSNHPVAFDRIC